jgi:hypothetical protein
LREPEFCLFATELYCHKKLMNSRTGAALTALAVFLTAGSVWAHHSVTNSSFDVSRPVTLVGRLQKVDWRNPHIQISVEAKGAGGKTETWVMEGMAPNALRGRNTGRSDFEKALGKTVNVDMVRARDGSRYALILQITFPGGKSVGLLRSNH